jgi:hypothetical protein
MTKEDFLVPGLIFKSPKSGWKYIIGENPKTNVDGFDIKIRPVNQIFSDGTKGSSNYNPFIYCDGKWGEIISIPQSSFNIFN